jgi:hypothetical protein
MVSHGDVEGCGVVVLVRLVDLAERVGCHGDQVPTVPVVDVPQRGDLDFPTSGYGWGVDDTRLPYPPMWGE